MEGLYRGKGSSSEWVIVLGLLRLDVEVVGGDEVRFI